MRKILEAEKKYIRIRDFLGMIPLDVYASLRNYILKSRVLDSLFERIRKGFCVSLEFKDEWQFCFWDEDDLHELLKQII